ncbi:MAG: ABC transporter ATP-binding protein [Candidatus Bathyarchaeota archaeon]|nr:ABC transporter ATP-binding protein [Candidatus Bathyarchaeota archaeon]
MPSIEAVNLTKRYGAFAAVSDLNFKIQGAKCVGFLGPNGAGKTTTLKMFTDLITPSHGKALINGRNVHTEKKQALSSVGTLIETPEIYPSLTPREALSMIAELRGMPAAERSSCIEHAVAQVKMSEWIDKKVGKFSKGMKQRICIAAALLSDPDVLLLDEPTTGLDPRGMSEVREIIKHLKSQSKLIFMSSHILTEVADVCDEVAIVDQGRLITYDSLAHVSARFSGGSNLVEAEFCRPLAVGVAQKLEAAVSDVIDVEKTGAKALTVRFNGGIDVQEQILQALVTLGTGVVSYKPASSDLEAVYLQLIKNTK